MSVKFYKADNKLGTQVIEHHNDFVDSNVTFDADMPRVSDIRSCHS